MWNELPKMNCEDLVNQSYTIKYKIHKIEFEID